MQRFFPFSFSGALGAGLLALGTLLAAGCQKHHEVPQALAEAPASARLAGGAAAPAELARAREDSAAEAPAERFLAVRHDLSVEVAPDKLPEAWASVRELCGTLRCELLSSSLQRETAQQAGAASLEMRVLPADVDRLLGGLAGVAQVVQHDTTSEDKTAEVVDVEAHIRNRTEFRDSLRAMLADKSVKREMSDLLEIQRTLADTQADLDSSATRRKILAQQTGMQHVQVRFTPTRALVQGARTGPIGRAMREAGEVLADSVAALITFVAAVLPWAVVAVPFFWGLGVLARAWRRRRARRTGA
ncbi:DUF4349 domain-containing protein [Xenophilus sp.]|uniref:DUF4349 domain-containing protein n=1 Tax=Xenophilus sp. TaxID=1873499 RepID=UPI0037DC675D